MANRNSGCGSLVIGALLIMGLLDYLHKPSTPAPATSSVVAAPKPASVSQPEKAATPLADLIVKDTSDFQAYAKKYGAWDYDPEHDTMSTSTGDGHHVQGIGTVHLSYLKHNPKAWLYYIEPAQAKIDAIVPDDDTNMEHVDSATDYDLYRVKTGPLKGVFIRTSGYSDPTDLRIDVYTPEFKKLFYKE